MDVNVVRLDTGHVELAELAIEDVEVRLHSKTLGEQNAITSSAWLIPAVFDAHVHVTTLPHEAKTLFITSGVTHVRDVGGDIEEVAQWVKGSQSPHVFGFGGPLDRNPLPPYLKGRFGSVPVRDLDDVRAHISRLTKRGACGMKLYYGFPPELVCESVKMAHEANLKVAFHVASGSLSAFRRTSVIDALLAGVDTIEHIHSMTGDILSPLVFQQYKTDKVETVGKAFGRVFSAWSEADLQGAECQRIIDLFVQTKAVLVPTLTPFALMVGVIESNTHEGLVKIFTEQSDYDQKLLKHGFNQMLQFVSDLFRAGGKIVSGSDTADMTGVKPGISMKEEIWLLLEAGLNIWQALKASTIAQYIPSNLGISQDHLDGNWVLLLGNTLENAVSKWDVQLVTKNWKVLYAKEDCNVPN